MLAVFNEVTDVSAPLGSMVLTPDADHGREPNALHGKKKYTVTLHIPADTQNTHEF